MIAVFSGNRDADRRSEREALLRQAADEFHKSLALDSENFTAHYQLGLIYAQLGNEPRAEEHRTLHARYKSDDNAGDRAIAAARQKYPAANHATERVVIYPLHRARAPGLDASQITRSE